MGLPTMRFVLIAASLVLLFASEARVLPKVPCFNNAKIALSDCCAIVVSRATRNKCEDDDGDCARAREEAFERCAAAQLNPQRLDGLCMMLQNNKLFNSIQRFNYNKVLNCEREIDTCKLNFLNMV